ncbi:hypothetical protein ACHAQA_009185 [Verticillium albo-atrum]
MQRNALAQSDVKCPTDLTFYRCRNNHYAGCCSVDPCELPGCPDDRDRLVGEEGNNDRGRQGDKPGDKDNSKNGNGEGDDPKDDKDGKEEKKTFTRTAIPTTVASLGTPLLPTLTEEPSTQSITTAEDAFSTEDSDATTRVAPPTRPVFDPTTTLARMTHSAQSLSSSTTISGPTETSTAGSAGSGGLSTAAKGGIFGAMGAAMLIVIVAFFLCGKRGRKLRKSLVARGNDSDGDPLDGKGGLQPFGSPPSGLIQEPMSNDVFSPFGGRYEEPQSRFTRACAYNRSHSMKNHPVSPMSRATMDLGPPPPIAQPPRPRTATPDFSRTDASTPELQGSPKRAAFAELASPGLPRLVQIPNNRHSVQRYKAYRPNEQMHPLCEGSAVNLRGDLAATQAERYQNTYVNSWSRWDSAVAH